MRPTVVVPTYNERANLPVVIERLLALRDLRVLVVDDGSPDGTGDEADRCALGSGGRVAVLHRRGRRGLGRSYIDGFRAALDEGATHVLQMDADLSHDPDDVPRLLQASGDADLVLGSRYVPGGSVVNWPRSREVLSRGGNLYARLALGIELRDATGGYRAFRRTTLEKLDLHDISSQGYCFQVDLAQRAIRRGLRVEEVPITFVEREFGSSKMSRAIVVEALWRLTTWGVRHRAGQVRDILRPGSRPPGEG